MANWTDAPQSSSQGQAHLMLSSGLTGLSLLDSFCRQKQNGRQSPW